MNKFFNFILLALILFPLLGITQNHYSIRLKPVGAVQGGKINYQVQLAAADGIPLNLAGQNYRLYFDASKLEIDQQGSAILLNTDLYTPLLWKQVVEKIDASSIGTLPYRETLGLINFGIDLEDNKTGGVTLPSSGEWLSIANLTFKVKNQADINPELATLSWARPSLTSDYATAFVEVAEWKSSNKTTPALVDTYYDQSFTTSIAEKDWIKGVAVFPNPVSQQLNIRYDSVEEIKLEIWNIQGKRLLRETLPKGNQLISRDFSKYASGTYQIRMIQDNQIYTELVERIQ